MSVSKDKNTGNWGYNFMHKGVRYHRNFKDFSKEKVEELESIAKSELIKNNYDIASENQPNALSEIVADYEEYAKNNLTRANEAIDHVKTFYRIVGNKPANQVSLSDLQKYISYRKNQKIKNNKNKYVSNASINREMDDIRRCFSIAKINKKIKVNPCDDLIDLRIENPTKRYLTKEEEKKLLEHANPIMKVIIITALHTGMRKSEIINLKWSDVFLDEGYLIALNTKNGRSRELIITPKMKEGLSGLSKLSEYVFTSPVTKTKYADFKSTFSRTVKRAKIPYITFHELRHTTASRLNELGVDLATIQEYLDHSDAKVTQKYIHKPRKNIIDAINRLSEY